MKLKKINKKVFLFFISLICFTGMKATPGCPLSYTIVNAQGIVTTTGFASGTNNQILLGAFCPGSNLIVTLNIAGTNTSIGACVTINTSSTPITYTLYNSPVPTLTIPISAYDPTMTLPSSISVGPGPTTCGGGGCQTFLFDIYPSPDPGFIVSPNPVCLNGTVCFSSTALPYSLATQNFGGYYMQPMTQLLYDNISGGLLPPDFS